MESEGRHDIAAFALSSFLEDADHLERVVDLIKRARPSQLPALINTLQKQGDEAISLLEGSRPDRIRRARTVPLAPTKKTPPESLRQTIEDAQGVVAPDFVVCQILPIEQVSDVLESLRELGIPADPAPAVSTRRTSCSWPAFGRVTNTTGKRKLAFPPIKSGSVMVRLRNENLGIDELAAYVEDDQWKFVAVWSEHPDALLESQVTLIEPQKNWQTTFDAHSSTGLQPYSYQLAEGPNGDLRRTQIWRRVMRTQASTHSERTITADRLGVTGPRLRRCRCIHAFRLARQAIRRGMGR